MEQSRLRRVLNRLYIEGKISKEDCEKITEEIPNKETDFEEKVNRAVHEIMDDGYIRQTFKRIYKAKEKKIKKPLDSTENIE